MVSLEWRQSGNDTLTSSPGISTRVVRCDSDFRFSNGFLEIGKPCLGDVPDSAMNRRKSHVSEKKYWASGRTVSNCEQLFSPVAVQILSRFLGKLAAAGERGASCEWLRRLIHAPLRA